MSATAFGSDRERPHWSRPVPTWFAVLLIWGLGGLAAWPALDGPWLFDDGQPQGSIAAMHTEGLSALAGNGWREQLIMRGAFPGRPIAMASFAANALVGTAPFGFKLVNLGLHLAVGTLVFFLVRVLFRTQPLRTGTDLTALIVALIWVLHPLHVSTWAYVVQRMTILSALFSVSALWLYARVRAREVGGGAPARISELLWPLLVLPALAFLSKENGGLLPLLLLVLEFCVFGVRGCTRTRRRLAVYFALAGISALLVTAALYPPARLANAYASLDFTLGERLLTEPRMLVMYLGQILLPRPDWMAFYYDGVQVSHGLLQPPMTLAAMLILTGLLGLGLALVRRRPVGAFGILMFFAGHAMESTFLPLQLAFEHRNYLPSLGIILAAADLLAAASGALARYRPVIAACALLGVFALAWLRADAWSSAEGIYITGLQGRLPSRGVRAAYAQLLTEQGRYPEARRLLADAYGLGPRLHEGYLDCVETGRLDPGRIQAARAQLDGFPQSYEASAIMNVGALAVAGTCAIPPDAFLDLLQAAAADRRFPAEHRRAFLQYAAHLHHAAGEMDQALAALELGYTLDPTSPVPLLTAAGWELDRGNRAAARAWYERARAVRLAPSANLDALFGPIEQRLQDESEVPRAGGRAGGTDQPPVSAAPP